MKKKSLVEVLREKLSSLPKRRRSIALFILENWEEIPLMSIKDVSELTGISPATISRMFKQLGFKGFPHLKKLIKEELNLKKESLPKAFEETTTKGNKKILVKIARQDIKNLSELLLKTDRKKLKKALQMIKKARRIYTLGIGSNSIFSHIASYLLNQIEKDTLCINDWEIPLEERVASLGKNDLLIVCCFKPYNLYTLDIAELAFKNDVELLLITDSDYSPLSRFSTLTLTVPSHKILFPNSFSAFSVLFNAIATELAFSKKNLLVSEKRKKDRMLRKFYFEA